MRESPPKSAEGYELHCEAGQIGWINSNVLRLTDRQESSIRVPRFPPFPRTKSLTLDERLILLAIRADRRRDSQSPLLPVQDRLIEMDLTAEADSTFSEWAYGRIPRSKIVRHASTLLCLENYVGVHPGGKRERRSPMPGDERATAWLDELERTIPEDPSADPSAPKGSSPDGMSDGIQPNIVSANDERDAWLYEKAQMGVAAKVIIRELKTIAFAKGWTLLTNWAAVKGAANRYARRKRLPELSPRKSGFGTPVK